MQYGVSSHALITKRERKEMMLTNEISFDSNDLLERKKGTFLFFLFVFVYTDTYLGTHMSSPFFLFIPVHT